MDFIDALPYIRKVANRFCASYKRYNPDELINEAWIRGWKNRTNPATDLPLIVTQTKRDILEYIRFDCKSRRKYNVITLTNVTSNKKNKNDSNNREADDFFSQIASSKDLKEYDGIDKIDNLDTIDNILESISARDRVFLTDYYLHDLNKDQMVEKYNVKKTTIEVYNARSLKECRKRVKEREMTLG